MLPVDLAVRDWARRDAAVADRLRRVDNRRMDYLRELIGTFCADADDVEARALLAFSLAIGNHFVAADHGKRSRAPGTPAGDGASARLTAGPPTDSDARADASMRAGTCLCHGVPA